MAQEITLVLDPGRTLTARLMQGSTVSVSGIALTESGIPGLYTGNVPGGTAAGVYLVLINDGAEIVATGDLVWDGTAEVVPGAGIDEGAIADAVWASAARTLTAAGAPVTTDIAAAVRSALAVELARVDASISSRSTYAGADTAGTTTLLSRVPGAVPLAADWTPSRAIKIDTLDRAASLSATQTSVNAIPTTAAPTAAANAAAVRGELAVELARVDAAVSSRESEASAAARAAAGIAEHDATQAAVAGITLPAIDAGTIASAVRADIERTGGPLDLVPTVAEIEASTVLAKQASVLAIGAAPTAAAVAAAVQAELGADFAALAAAVATRLAASGYAAPDNAGILAAIANLATSSDPLASSVPGAYAPGTAGHAISRLAIVPGAGPILPIPDAPAASSGLCRVFGFMETPDNRPAANVKILFTLDSRNPAASERLVVGRVITAITNAAGQLVTGPSTPWVDLQRNDMLQPGGTSYLVDCEELRVHRRRIFLSSETADLKALIMASPT